MKEKVQDSIKHRQLDIPLNYKVIYNHKTELDQAEKWHMIICTKVIVSAQ